MYSNLAQPLLVKGSVDGLTLATDARAEAWADELELEGATALAWYEHPHFGSFPAITSQSFGTGRVTYAGTLPNRSLGETLASWVLSESGIHTPVVDIPDSVRINTARSASGRRLWFLSNWSGHPATLPALPAGGEELFSGVHVETGDALDLSPWDMKILMEV